jgi:tetratricopeptide (TPR) repeat protein
MSTPRGQTRTWAEVFDVTRLEAYGIAGLAQQFLDTGQLQKSKDIVEGLVALNPADAYFPALLGAICGRMGDEDAALAHYTRAIELDGRNLPALVSRADIYLRRGSIEPALGDLTVAVQCDPQGKTKIGQRAIALARATADGMRAFVAQASKSAKPPAAAPPPSKSAPVKKPAAAAPAKKKPTKRLGRR